jgi:thioredoxin 1
MTYLEKEEDFEKLISNDLVLVDFYANWCGPCQMLSPVLEKMSQEYKDIEFVKVNTDDFLDLAKEYKIMSIPALKVFEKGHVTKESVGLLSKAELMELLDK